MNQLLKKPGLPVAVVILLVVVSLISVPNVLRIIMTVPFVLFLPGFASTMLLFRRDHLGLPERLLLSVALSVALTALIGLILHWTPWGLSPTTLWIGFALLAAGIAVLLMIRRQQWTNEILHPIQPNFTLRQWILVALAALVTVMAIFVARSPVDQQGFEGYTTLWIQPSETPDMIRIGVICEEFEPTKYQIRFELNNAVHQGPIVELQPGETWEGLVRVPSEQLGRKPLTVLLYRVDHPTAVYRHAVWWPD